MSRARWGPGDGDRYLLDAWERRCRTHGDPAACEGAEAVYLVEALNDALRRGSGTPELGRAARTWGGGFPAPVAALEAICQLREAVAETTGQAEAEGPAAPAVFRLFDQAMLEAVDAATANLRSAARIDPLTNCANRRAFDEELGRALSSAQRSGLDMALVLVDMDGLKSINDTRGHAAGDAALVALVETLRGVLRDADSLYRTGGDEFAVLAPFTDASGARSLMRRAEEMGGPAFSWGVAASSSLAGGTGSGPGSGREGWLETEAAAFLNAADADLYARRRARRRAHVRTRRKRRTLTAVSVVAAAAAVASGGALAATLTGGSMGTPHQRSSGPQALAAGGGSSANTPLRPGLWGGPLGVGRTAAPSGAGAGRRSGQLQGVSPGQVHTGVPAGAASVVAPAEAAARVTAAQLTAARMVAVQVAAARTAAAGPGRGLEAAQVAAVVPAVVTTANSYAPPVGAEPAQPQAAWPTSSRPWSPPWTDLHGGRTSGVVVARQRRAPQWDFQGFGPAAANPRGYDGRQPDVRW
ncbi:MAG TPA: GGDEF domain-containing protein [Acidimicrobiales bacterium]|nr:GGDEF domain-containing protein [Acidimicrobiales bacterium]